VLARYVAARMGDPAAGSKRERARGPSPGRGVAVPVQPARLRHPSEDAPRAAAI